MIDGFTPTRAAALKQMAAFAPKAGADYARFRNFDTGSADQDAVSRLSPNLRCRVLTEGEVIREILEHHDADSAEKFIQEVFWRTYWKGWLELRPQVWEQYLNALGQRWNEVQTQSGLRARWEAACSGATEIDCFNFWSKELVNTGYLHNHARMWFASIWIFTLELPWELGADFFLRHLLDGDPASNTLGWRWVAGIQTPGKTYLARADNIEKFTQARFFPDGQLATTAPPVRGPERPPLRDLSFASPPKSGRRSGFLVHEDDLSPDLPLKALAPVSCALLSPQTHIGPLHPAPQVAGFRAALQADAEQTHHPFLRTASQVHDVASILDWCQSERLEQIITAHAPTGPVSTLLAALEKTKGAPRICRVTRSLDQTAWPLATRGFFPFKKHIPELIEIALTDHYAGFAE